MRIIFTIFAFLFVQFSFSQCFEIERILVDACDGAEGQNEMVRFVVGPNALNTNNISVNWPSQSWQGIIQNAATTNKVASINATIITEGGCGQVLQPTAGVLPANSVVILVTGLNFNENLNTFGALNETVYMIFQNNPNVTGGHFGNYNPSPGLRTLTINFGASCSDTVTYERSDLINQDGDPGAEDGATVVFSPAGVPTYINDGCLAPVQVLEAEITTNATVLCENNSIDLTATTIGASSVLWTTSEGVLSSNSSNTTTLSFPVAPINNQVTVTFTATSACGSTETDSIILTIGTNETPTFALPSVLCSGATAPTLSNTSANGITGSWLPANINNTATTTYTFTPDADLFPCANSVDFTIEILNDCTFNAYATALWIDTCETPGDGEFFNVTGSGVDLIGNPDQVFPNADLGVFQQNSNALILRGAEVKTFKSNNSDVCGTKLYYRIYEQTATPGTFVEFPLDFFDECDAPNNQFPTGGPCQAGNQKWQRVLNDTQNPINLTNFAVGTYFLEVYFDVNGTFINGTNNCNDVVLVANNGNNFKATFAIQAAPLLTSTPIVSCDGTEGSITITGLNPNTNFELNYLLNNISQGPFSVTSSGSGTILIENLSVGSYTNFQLTANECVFNASNSVNLINPVFTPDFDAVTAICVGENLTALPTTSNNNITGSWSPELNNQQTTTYTFTPDAGQCADEATLEIVVNPLSNVVFDFGNNVTICENQDFDLPNISSNDILGIWSPSFVNNSGIYVFTPNDACAEDFVLNINIAENPNSVVNQGCQDIYYTLSVEPSVSNSLYLWTNSNGGNIGNGSAIIVTNPGIYTVEVTTNGCVETFEFDVTSTYCGIPKGISPNGDQFNNNFDLSNFEVEKVQIFNRYGREVYSKTNYVDEWNGLSNDGSELPTATYFYVISFQSGLQTTGWVYLQR